MLENLLEPRLIRMPELAQGAWLNVTAPLMKEQFLGRVILVDFWDYTCVNCLRTLPYLKAWQERYVESGFQVIGIHAPEFAFGGNVQAVESAIEEFELPYPVLLDNNYENWERFANKAWPTKYLVDAAGYLRFRRQGEGSYHQTEAAIQQLLRERDPDVTCPELMETLRPEDNSGAVCYRATPELFTGYQMGGLRGHSLGNADGHGDGTSRTFRLPPDEQRLDGWFYLAGAWSAQPDSIRPISHSCQLFLPYSSITANMVVGPVSRSDSQPQSSEQADDRLTIEIKQDGTSLTAENAGKDVTVQPDGRSTITVLRDRMVELVRNKSFERHELTLSFASGPVNVYSFSFTSCVVVEDQLAFNKQYVTP